jgi:hypothetical protein
MLTLVTFVAANNNDLLKSYEQLVKIDEMEHRDHDASEIEHEIAALEPKATAKHEPAPPWGAATQHVQQRPPWDVGIATVESNAQHAEDASLACCRKELGKYCPPRSFYAGSIKSECNACIQEHKSRIVYDGMNSVCTMADLDRSCAAVDTSAQHDQHARPPPPPPPPSQKITCMTILHSVCTNTDEKEAHVCRQCVHERIFAACTQLQKDSFCPHRLDNRLDRMQHNGFRVAQQHLLGGVARSAVMAHERSSPPAGGGENGLDDVMIAASAVLFVGGAGFIASTMVEKSSVGSSKRNRSLADQAIDELPDYGLASVELSPLRSSGHLGP